MPVDRGRGIFEPRVTVRSYKYNPQDSNYCVCGIPEDEPNIDWILQHRDVVEFDEDGFIVDTGKEQPTYPREKYTRKEEADDRLRPDGAVVDDIDSFDLTYRTDDISPLSPDDVMESTSWLDLDYTDAVKYKQSVVVRGDRASIGRLYWLYFPKEDIIIAERLTVAREYTGLPYSKVVDYCYEWQKRDFPGLSPTPTVLWFHYDKSDLDLDRMRPTVSERDDLPAHSSGRWLEVDYNNREEYQ